MARQVLFGIAVSTIFFFLRYAVKDVPPFIAWAGVIVGLVICGLTLTPIATIASRLFLPISMIGAGSLLLITGAVLLYERLHNEGGDKPSSLLAEAIKHRPEVGLRFVYPKSPALIIVNKSPVLARDITWTIALWNMNHPERVQQLPIPSVSTLGWVKPNDESGPINLFDDPRVTDLIKPGDRLFGMAAVQCVPCARGRTYVVSIVWGESGWYSETEASGEALIPGNQDAETLRGYFKGLEEVSPQESRVSIENEKTPLAAHSTLTLSIQLLFQQGRMYFVNTGPNAFYVWGAKFGNTKTVEPSGQLVGENKNLSFTMAEPPEAFVRDNSKANNGFLPVEIYLTDVSQKQKFTGQFLLTTIQNGTSLEVRTLSFGVIEGGC